MPPAASTDAAERIPDAWVDVVDGAGHFVWWKRQARLGHAPPPPRLLASPAQPDPGAFPEHWLS